jgi:hypothetical protein
VIVMPVIQQAQIPVTLKAHGPPQMISLPVVVGGQPYADYPMTPENFPSCDLYEERACQTTT